MFEPQRKYKTCIMCGRYDMTREHIFGKSFADYLDVQHHWKADQYTPTGEKHAKRSFKKGPSPITNIAPRVLCNKCNSERLSGTMNSSLPYLISCASGESFSLTPDAQQSLRRYFERVAMIIDVCTSAEQMQQSKRESAKHRHGPALISFDQRKAWLNEEIAPENLNIYLGFHKGVLGLNPDVNIRHTAAFKNGGIQYGKRITMVIQRLAICLDINMSDFECPGETFYPLKEITNWPPNTDVSYDDYYALRNQDDITRRYRQVFSNTALVEEIEALSIPRGEVTFPIELEPFLSQA
jgi:hypothetical protein